METEKYYKVQIRVPAALEGQLKAEAKKERRSVANYVLCALEDRLENKKGVEDNATTP